MKKVLIALTLILFLLIITPIFLPSPNLMDIDNSLSLPSLEHILGTDSLGRDLFSRCINGARNSFFISFSVALLSTVCGFIIGSLSLFSKILDEVLMRLMDSIKALPAILFASLLIVTVGKSTPLLVLSLSTAFIPQCARLVRSEGKMQLQSEYYLAGLSLGHDEKYYKIIIVFRHTLMMLINQIPFIFSSSVILEATLSFIGAGLDETSPTLGGVIQESRGFLLTRPYMIVFPILLILIFTLTFSFLGERIKKIRH